MSPSFRRGYNAALLALRRTFKRTLTAGRISGEQRETLVSVSATCWQMRQRARSKVRHATFATFYGISLRTVKNWKRAGCPFLEGRKAVLLWMLARRYLPNGPKRKFARELRELAFTKAMAAFREAKDAARQFKGETALGNLALRLRLAFEAMEPLDGESILRKSRDFSKLAKAAVSHGFWE